MTGEEPYRKPTGLDHGDLNRQPCGCWLRPCSEAHELKIAHAAALEEENKRLKDASDAGLSLYFKACAQGKEWMERSEAKDALVGRLEKVVEAAKDLTRLYPWHPEDVDGRSAFYNQVERLQSILADLDATR